MWVIRNCISQEDRQYNGQKDNEQKQTIIYKILHRKLKIKYHEFEIELEFWCLTPLSAIFQLYHGDQF